MFIKIVLFYLVLYIAHVNVTSIVYLLYSIHICGWVSNVTVPKPAGEQPDTK